MSSSFRPSERAQALMRRMSDTPLTPWAACNWWAGRTYGLRARSSLAHAERNSSSWGRSFILRVLRVPVPSESTGHSFVIGYPLFGGDICLVQEDLAVLLGPVFGFGPRVTEGSLPPEE